MCMPCDSTRERAVDLIDLAVQREELLRAEALSLRKPEGPAANGMCLYCEEPLADGRRWCDAEHRDGWQREQ